MNKQNTKKGAAGSTKKKKALSIRFAYFKINATTNNTFITVTSPSGQVLVSYSPGRLGYKGSRKSNAFAATQAATEAAKIAKDSFNVQEAEVHIKGIGQGREAAAGAIHKVGIDVRAFIDFTNPDIGGCKKKKRRRV